MARGVTVRAERLGYVDALRGLGAVAVALFWHYQHFAAPIQPGGLPFAAAPGFRLPGFGTLYRHGYLAVDLFFMISGIVFQHVYGTRRAGIARHFLWHRVARIYPMHLLGLLVTAAVVWVFHHAVGRFPIYTENGPRAFVANLLFVQGLGWLTTAFSFDGPSWTLSIEALMYALFLATPRRGGRAALAASGLALWPLLEAFGQVPSIARGLAAFFLGTLIHEGTATRRRAAWLLAAYAIGMGAYAAAMKDVPAPFEADCPLSWAVFGTALIGLRAAPAAARWLLEWRVLLWLGDLSLGIYLLHVPLQVVLLLAWHGRVPLDRIWFAALYATLLLLIAHWLHHRFEVPARLAVRRWTGTSSRHEAAGEGSPWTCR